jgi:hypothetical protein
MKEQLGVFEIGWENVLLIVDAETTGGSFTMCPKESVPEISIGIKYDKFQHVLGVLIHEAMEFALTRLQARYSPSLEIAGDHSAYLFSFNHVVLSESSYMVAEYINSAIEPLRKAWEERPI